MHNRISNELVAFSILALLVIGNLFYLFMPGLDSSRHIARADRQAVAAIGSDSAPQIGNGSEDLLNKEGLVTLDRGEISGSGKGSMLLQSDFAILFEAQESLEDVESQWRRVSEAYGEAMANLMPLARIEDKSASGGRQTTLHLAVGPFENMQEAAYLCVSLQRKGENCTVSPFSGQPLDIFGQAALGSMSKSFRELKQAR